ncbi:MAG: hypothetical protein ACQEUZ_12575 [Pseudomonadota bacterium]
MSDARIDAPFGTVTLSADAGTPGETAEMRPELPSGLRVDGCRAGVLTLAFSTGEVRGVSLDAALAPGAKARRGAGGGLRGWEVEADGLVGAFALPDAARLEREHGLRLAGFAERSSGVTFRLRAETATVAAIPFAAAWTLNPITEADALAPWFAIERALPPSRT